MTRASVSFAQKCPSEGNFLFWYFEYISPPYYFYFYQVVFTQVSVLLLNHRMYFCLLCKLLWDNSYKGYIGTVHSIQGWCHVLNCAAEAQKYSDKCWPTCMKPFPNSGIQWDLCITNTAFYGVTNQFKWGQSLNFLKMFFLKNTSWNQIFMGQRETFCVIVKLQHSAQWGWNIQHVTTIHLKKNAKITFYRHVEKKFLRALQVSITLQ